MAFQQRFRKWWQQVTGATLTMMLASTFVVKPSAELTVLGFKKTTKRELQQIILNVIGTHNA